MRKTQVALGTLFLAATLVCVAPGAANAQFPSMPGMGGGGAKADGAKIEKDLNEILSLTSRAISAFASALGMKEEADEMTKTADCLKAGTCNGAAKVSVITDTGGKMSAKIDELQKSNQKLQADSGKKAAEGLSPTVKSFLKWKDVGNGIANLKNDKQAALQFGSLINASTTLPGAVENQGKTINKGIEYLTFSGIQHDLKPVDPKVLVGL